MLVVWKSEPDRDVSNRLPRVQGICAINGRRGILKRKDAAPPVP